MLTGTIQVCDGTMIMFVFTVGLLALLPGSFSSGKFVNISTTNPTIRTQIVNKHNTLRRGVQPTASNMLKMSWNGQAEDNAQSWANTCAMDHTSGCGENLYMSSSPNSWDDAVQSWYDEVKDYRYGYGSVNGGVIGHYTQVVWYRSNKVGCGVAYCPNSEYNYFYVCQYCPPGNFQYDHPYESGPTCGDCPNACNNKLCNNPCQYLDKYSNCASLKSQWGCSGDIGEWCPASCKCVDKIM
ncbi:hypothetical protein AAFF_G00088290 [Aldrovandia affinis]|uniref:ShKT domain-containing protein n=1 Tax=Aldrovandia affinis TaxID=143900 RepID=A0AAD7RWF1_9TELE|nr:hypothetical protein AAFF_G00088290 [Aldrovandia affinis]